MTQRPAPACQREGEKSPSIHFLAIPVTSSVSWESHLTSPAIASLAVKRGVGVGGPNKIMFMKPLRLS